MLGSSGRKTHIVVTKEHARNRVYQFFSILNSLAVFFDSFDTVRTAYIDFLNVAAFLFVKHMKRKGLFSRFNDLRIGIRAERRTVRGIIQRFENIRLSLPVRADKIDFLSGKIDSAVFQIAKIVDCER